MSKVERGLPKGFDIKVPQEPVDLGDYLDDRPASVKVTPVVAAVVDPPPASSVPVAPVAAAPVPVAPVAAAPVPAASVPVVPSAAPPLGAVPVAAVPPVASGAWPPPAAAAPAYVPPAPFVPQAPYVPPAPYVPQAAYVPPVSVPAAVGQMAVRRSTRGKQRQFNMAPEALRMLEEVMVYLRANSPERDLRASEVMHGLVLALHGALPRMDLNQIPPRGKWGSPTAAALPFALKQMFEAAFRRG